VDPTHEQWQGIVTAIKERKLLPFADSAYQVGGQAGRQLGGWLGWLAGVSRYSKHAEATQRRALCRPPDSCPVKPPASFFSMQGFASGDLDRDGAAIRMLADAGLEMLLAQVGGVCV